MNKLTIPALLLGVVMIAGAFAFMPVQEASTVHTSTTFLGNQDKIKTATSSSLSLTAGTTTDTFTATIDMNEPFELLNISVTCSSGNTGATDVTLCGSGESMDIVSVEVDGQTTATVLTISAQVGTDATGNTIVLPMTANTGSLLPFVASDKVIVNFVADTDATAPADDGMDITVTVTIKIASGTTFATANITVA